MAERNAAYAADSEAAASRYGRGVIERPRFELALERLSSGDWELFEQFANRFLAPEFPNLRPTANPSGDGGRDASLWQDEGDSSVVLQYSVTESWSAKVRRTAALIKQNFPNTSVLIYVTSKDIAAKADSLRGSVRKDFGLYLDIRDRTWFLDIADPSRPREEAAERLAEQVVDPLLLARGVVRGRGGQALTSPEAQAAFMYLALELEDDTRQKGLTKLSYEALVRTVLRGTSSDNRKSRAQIHEDVQALLPDHEPAVVEQYTDSALRRLNKRYVRYWKKDGEFCLTHEEVIRLRTRLTQIEAEGLALDDELAVSLTHSARRYDFRLPDESNQLVTRVRRVVERVLLTKGEMFVAAVADGSGSAFPFDEVEERVIQDLGEHPDSQGLGGDLIPVVADAVRRIFREPSPKAQQHLRSLADTYTLCAFLRQTPNVQNAVSKIFSKGEIWLDTSVVLPLLAEGLVGEPSRAFTNLLTGAREAGLNLLVTDGVLDEVEAHLNLALVYARHNGPQPWRGRVPFIYAAFALTGRPKAEFPAWLENFRGPVRSRDDVQEFLQREFRIETGSLEAETDRAPEELRRIVQEAWYPVHQRRGEQRGDRDPGLAAILVRHDVENYVGVIERRNQERDSPFGYTTWCLTLDQTASEVTTELKKCLGHKAPQSPVLSADFLANLLAFGPLRRRVDRRTEGALPLSVEMAPLDLLPQELLDLADELRAELAGLPDPIVNRRVRDALDAARARLGDISKGGVDARLEELKKQIIADATPSDSS